jgi:hypothetical protein
VAEPLTMTMRLVDAFRLGEACNKAAKEPIDTYLDRGLALLRLLNEAGFDVIAKPKEGVHAQPCTPGRTVQRRLLDMLAGWSQYLEKCSLSEDASIRAQQEVYIREAASIDKLYQDVASCAEFSVATGELRYYLRQVEEILLGPEE